MKYGLLLLSSMLTIQSLNAQTLTLSSNKQTDLSLTLYTNNLALVQDNRILGPIKPEDTIIVKGISQNMHPQSLQIADAGKIIEQTLNRDTISYRGLIKAHIGKQIVLVKETESGQEIRQTVTLLNVSDNTAIVELNEHIESIPLTSNHWRFVFPNKPENLLLKPSLTFKSEGKSTTNNIKLSYLTNGLEWRMDYVLQLNQNRDQLAFRGLASLFNNTSTLFSNARIKLLAGNINQPQVERLTLSSAAPVTRMMAKAASGSSIPSDLGDLKLYKLPQRTTLKPQQQTQVPLLQAEKVAVKTHYRHSLFIAPFLDHNEVTANPSTSLIFSNTEKNKLGLALPAGQARVYTPDENGALQFIGASQLSASSKGDTIELSTGKAFDISIKQRQSSFSKTFDGSLASFQLIISNSSSHTKYLDLTANFSQQWEIISSTFPITKKSAASAHWRIKLLANSSNVFDLKTRLRKPN